MKYNHISVRSGAWIKSFLFILALLCPAMCSFGQLYIKGTVTDGQQFLPSVTVLLLGLDSTLVKGTATDSTGEFIFDHVAPGHYLISAAMVGYSKFISQRISVTERNIVVPEITLTEVTTGLNTVTVKAEKQLFDQKVDRLVINMESSITSSGNTILEALQKSPGVVVNRQNNMISMNGKTGVRIMINEKIIQVPPDVVVQMLDGMSASNVEKIELITTPPAAYDAEGNAGIIHIVTKEHAGYGTSGSFGLMLGARWAETLGGNFALNHRKKKFGEKGTIRLSMDDILYTNNWRIKTHSPVNNLYTYFNYDWHNQFIRLTYTMSLGNNKLRLLKLRSGSEEEKGRVNN